MRHSLHMAISRAQVKVRFLPVRWGGIQRKYMCVHDDKKYFKITTQSAEREENKQVGNEIFIRTKRARCCGMNRIE